MAFDFKNVTAVTIPGLPEGRTVKSMSVNGTVIWQGGGGADLKYTPFYIENPNGSSASVTIKKSSSSAPTLTVERSTDGQTWTAMSATSTSGVSATVPANGKLYLRCNASAWNGNKITCSKIYNVGGNIMSLLYGSSFTGEETTLTGTNTFNGLFESSTTLVSAEKLLLPATTITSNCYQAMFKACSALTTAPSELPATALASYCYLEMFRACTSLTAAPDLPASTLVYNCYVQMFSYCQSLTYIKTAQTTWNADWCYNWTSSLPASGTFYKKSTLASRKNTSGNGTNPHYIPYDWTVIDY